MVRAAFDHHREVADLVDLIRASPQFVPELSLVARHDGQVVGHVMLSHADLVDELGDRHRILTLSPLSVAPALQRRGIGSALVPAGLAAADALGEHRRSPNGALPRPSSLRETGRLSMPACLAAAIRLTTAARAQSYGGAATTPSAMGRQSLSSTPASDNSSAGRRSTSSPTA